MKNWIFKNSWWLLIICLPILLTVILHLGRALTLYTGTSFNIDDISAVTWFMFMGSYLGGVVTLIGVRLTITNALNTHAHQIAIQKIEKEQEVLSFASSQINPNEPINIFKIYFALSKQNTLTHYDIANIHDRINTQQHNISHLRVRVFTETSICDINPTCHTCRKPCMLKTINPDFTALFEKVTNTIFETFELLKKYINDCSHNKVLYDKIEKEDDPKKKKELENQVINTISDGDKLEALCKECAGFNSKEFTQLMGLIKQFVAIKKDNAQKACFG